MRDLCVLAAGVAKTAEAVFTLQVADRGNNTAETTEQDLGGPAKQADAANPSFDFALALSIYASCYCMTKSMVIDVAKRSLVCASLSSSTALVVSGN